MTTTNNNGNSSDFFDFKTGGIAYLNRAREVRPKKGQPFMAVTCAILNGKKDDVQYVYIDCNVVGKKAIEQIKALHDDINNGAKVLGNVLIGDLWADPYMKEGQPQAALKGRLLSLSNIKVNGQLLTLGEEEQQANPSNGSAGNQAPQKLELPQIQYGHDLWPVVRAVKLDPSNESFQTMLQKLISVGYEYNPENNVCRVVEGSPADEQRKVRVNELRTRVQESVPKAANA